MCRGKGLLHLAIVCFLKTPLPAEKTFHRKAAQMVKCTKIPREIRKKLQISACNLQIIMLLYFGESAQPRTFGRCRATGWPQG